MVKHAAAAVAVIPLVLVVAGFVADAAVEKEELAYWAVDAVADAADAAAFLVQWALEREQP